jgi:hypothetical protein
MHASYTDDLTMQTARDRYFEANDFGPDGGYNDAWVDFKLGPIPLPFPNTAGRVEAVKFHDLHHVLTGYETNATGELEISAWEIGAGCRGFVTAWALNLSGMAAGLVAAPRRTFRAFVRGRRSTSLYGETFEPLLEKSVGDMRARFVAKNGDDASSADVAAFIVASAAGSAVALAFLAAGVPLVPIGLVASWIARRHGSAANTVDGAPV